MKPVLLVIVLLLVLAAFVGVGKYNGLVGANEKVQAAWSEIDNQYKRRYDLIPNLVEAVKGAADFERGTLEAVTKARADVGRAQLPNSVPTDPKQLEAYIQAQQGLGAALGRLFAVAENYPQLKATENFRDLQTQLEGTENRIAVARRDYIDATQAYNTQMRSFPTNLVASMFSFQPAAQFTAPPAEREVPKVNFGTQGK